MRKQTNVTTEEETKKLTKREKTLIIATVVFTCAAGYFGVKYTNNCRQIEKLKTMKKTNTGYTIYF